MEPQIIIHVDVDAFFCQVEALRCGDGSLRDVPLAVQQHQDIIAVDYRARAAGVQKHMSPAEARRRLAPMGGRVVHVYCEDGTRPSYRPYRETSSALMRLLRQLLSAGAVLEKASIDEAFISLPALHTPPDPPDLPGPPGLPPLSIPPLSAGDAKVGPGQWLSGCAMEEERQRSGKRAAAADSRMSEGGGEGGGGAAQQPALARAWGLGERIRSESLARLGLRVSVGLAPNKLLAKLASRAAKPDGMRALTTQAQAEELLAATPIARLPGMGGRVAEALAAAGHTTAAQLRHLSTAALTSLTGLRPAAAAQLAEWGRGQDSRTVAERGPPAAIQVQMTLTPVPRRAHPAMLERARVRALPDNAAAGGAATAAASPAADATAGRGVGDAGGTGAAVPPGRPGVEGGSTGDGAAAAVAAGMLLPLLPRSPDGRARLERLVRSMAGDLVARVLLDRHQERRWPCRLTVKLMTHGSGGRTVAKTCAFPSPSLAPPPSPSPPPAATGRAAATGSPAGATHGGATHVAADHGRARAPGPSTAGAAAASTPAAAVGAVAAAAVPQGVGDGGLIVGEHTFYQPGTPCALLEAVASNALALCGAALGGSSPGLPLVQLHLTAHAFKPLGAAGGAGAITPFLAHHATARAGGGGDVGGDGGGGGGVGGDGGFGSAQQAAPQRFGAAGSPAPRVPAAFVQESPAIRTGCVAPEAPAQQDASAGPARKRARPLAAATPPPPSAAALGQPLGKPPDVPRSAPAAQQSSHPPMLPPPLPGEPPPAPPLPSEPPQPPNVMAPLRLQQQQLQLQQPQQSHQALQQQEPQQQQGPGAAPLPRAQLHLKAQTAAQATPPPHRPRAARLRAAAYRRQAIPPRIDLTQLLSSLWPERGDGGRGPGPAGSAVAAAATAAAEEALQRMDAWMGVFGAPAAEEWWNSLG